MATIAAAQIDVDAPGWLRRIPNEDSVDLLHRLESIEQRLRHLRRVAAIIDHEDSSATGERRLRRPVVELQGALAVDVLRVGAWVPRKVERKHRAVLVVRREDERGRVFGRQLVLPLVDALRRLGPAAPGVANAQPW